MDAYEKKYLIKFTLDFCMVATILEQGALNNCTYSKGTSGEEVIHNEINVPEAIEIAHEHYGKFNYSSPILCGNMSGNIMHSDGSGFFYLIFNPAGNGDWGPCLEFSILPAYLIFTRDFSVNNKTVSDHIDLDKYIRIGLTFCRDFPIRKLEVAPLEEK